MSQSKEKRADNRSVKKAPSSKTTDRDQRGRWTAVIIASVVAAIILIIVGFFYDREYGAPFRHTIIRVDNTAIDMDYFLKRTREANVDPMRMLETLTREQLIKLEAPQYGIEVSPEDIDQELRAMASGGSGIISESEFKEWYRQQRYESRLSDSEYREITATNLLTLRLHQYLAERVATVAEQIHLHAILLETYEDAEKVRARWEAGEDFADLAREASLDEGSSEKGGDLGWVARGTIPFEQVAFSLSPGEVSTPLPTGEEGYCLLMVSEKADARELDAVSLQALRGRALEDWLSEAVQFHEVTYHGFNNGYDSETNAWINWQLSKE